MPSILGRLFTTMVTIITVIVGGTTAAESAVGDTESSVQGPLRFQYRGGLPLFLLATTSGLRLPKPARNVP